MRQRSPVRVFKTVAAAAPDRPRRQHMVKDCLVGDAVDRQALHNVVELRAGGDAPLVALDVLGQTKLLGRQRGQRHFREQPPPHDAAEHREIRVFQAFDPDRQDHRVGLVGDHAGAFVDFHQGPSRRRAPLRKDHAGAPAFEGVDHHLRRQGMGLIQRTIVADAPIRLQPPSLRDLRVRCEEHSPRQQSRQHDSVERGYVIGDDENARPSGGEMFEPANLGAEKQPQGETHQKERQNLPQQAGYGSSHETELRRKSTSDAPQPNWNGAGLA
jgi:hypothetical protein